MAKISWELPLKSNLLRSLSRRRCEREAVAVEDEADLEEVAGEDSVDGEAEVVMPAEEIGIVRLVIT